MLRYKDPKLADEFAQCPDVLQYATSIFCYLSEALDIDPVITNVFGAPAGSTGVHAQKRAVDFRDQHAGAFLYTLAQRQWIQQVMNERFARVDGFQTLVHHSFRGGPLHWHLQVPDDLSKYSKETKINERLERYHRISEKP